MKNNNMINSLATAAIFLAVVGMVLISGCSQQKQEPAAAQQPQVQQTPITPAETQYTQPPQVQAQQQEADPDLYKDNLDSSIDELNQLGT